MMSVWRRSKLQYVHPLIVSCHSCSELVHIGNKQFCCGVDYLELSLKQPHKEDSPEWKYFLSMIHDAVEKRKKKIEKAIAANIKAEERSRKSRKSRVALIYQQSNEQIEEMNKPVKVKKKRKNKRKIEDDVRLFVLNVIKIDA